MRAKTKQIPVKVTLGAVPPYVQLAQRHFEKAPPKGQTDGEVITFPIPVDLLRHVAPAGAVEGVDEVFVAYKRRSR